MRLCVLDQSGTAAGRTPADAVQETLALARHCDGLGYHRYWLAEHHNSAAQAGTAPEVLMAAIAASRIDMGLGRAPGSDGRTAYALNPLAGEAAEHFPAQVRDLLAWVGGAELPEGHPFRGVTAQPDGPTVPEAWILGSSDYGAQVAAHFGLPYCFAHFITDGRGAAEAMEVYRRAYRPSARHPEPYGAVCVWALAADTDAQADRLFTSRAHWRLGRDRGVYAPMLSPEEVAAHPHTEAERARMAQLRTRALVGTGPEVVARLGALAGELGLQEVAVLGIAHDPAARRRSYTLLAEAAGSETGASGTGAEAAAPPGPGAE